MQQKNIIKIITVIIIICLPTIGAFANAGFEEEVMDTPIDGGLSLLVAAGVGCGAEN